MGDSYSTLAPGQVVQPCPAKQNVFWIEVELAGEDGSPIAWEEYRVQLPDGQIAEGLLDQDGWTRIDGISSAGTCQVCFPNLDQGAWHFIESEAAKE